MVERTTYSGLSAPPVTGPDYMNQIAERIDTLFDTSCLPLTGVGGTGNALTATLDPPLATPNVLVNGMKFTLTCAAANTGGVTLSINGETARQVVDAEGVALVAGALKPGLRILLEFVTGSGFRVLNGAGGGGAASLRYYQAFTASGTWTKPAGLSDNTMVTIEAWGAGAGGDSGASGGGGGGGGYAMRRFRLADLPSTVTVTVAAGGAINTAGGNTTFGALMTAYGGGRPSSTEGGGGAGALEAGQSASSGSNNGGRLGGGDGGPLSANQTLDARNPLGGGGGGGGSASPTVEKNGGAAVNGGGGGGGDTGTGGVSLYGGTGGNTGVAGGARGGGGGRNAAGGRGEVRVWI